MNQENDSLQWEKIRATIKSQPVPELLEFKSDSPHQVVLVLISSRSEYERFLVNHNLSRSNYQFLHNPDQLLTYGWDNAYLLKVGSWHLSPLLADKDGYCMLNIRFPWWKD